MTVREVNRKDYYSLGETCRKLGLTRGEVMALGECEELTTHKFPRERYASYLKADVDNLVYFPCY